MPQPDRGQPTAALDQAGSMPLVGLGTLRMTGVRRQAAARSALEVGYRHIDTAAIYRKAREVGRAVRDSGVPLRTPRPLREQQTGQQLAL